MFMAYRCTSLEIVASYSLDRSLGAIDSPDFQHPFITSLRASIPFFWILKYFPFLMPLVTNPSEFVISQMTALKSVFEFRHELQKEIDEILDNPEMLKKAEHQTVYEYLLARPEEKKERRDLTREDMFEEALALLIAGSDTVGNTASVGTYHVLANNGVLEKLRAELKSAWPDPDTPFTYSSLEKLPYLVSSLYVDSRSQGAPANQWG
jgi:cytochrome P450